MRTSRFAAAGLLGALSLIIFSEVAAVPLSEHWARIESLTRNKAWADSVGAVEAAIREFPDSPELRGTYAWVLREAGRPAAAITSTQEALIRWPDNQALRTQQSYNLCARFDQLFKAADYKAERMTAEAFVVAERARELQSHAWSETVYGVSLRLRGQFAQSADHLQETAKRFPDARFVKENLVGSYLAFADDLRQKKQYTAAIVQARHAVALHPDHRWGVLLIGLSYLDLNEPEKALPYLEKHLRTASSTAEKQDSTQNLAWCYGLLASKYRQAGNRMGLERLRQSVEALANGPFSTARPFVHTLNIIADADESFERLIAWQRTRVAQFPNDHGYLTWLGSTLNRLRLRQEREQNPAAEATQKEANQLLRRGMSLFEKQNPDRQGPVGLALPLRGRVLTMAAFDSGGTHSGYEKYSYDFAHVDQSNRWFRANTDGTNNNDYPTFGKEVYAVADGVVASIDDSHPDNHRAGRVAFGPGNSLQIRHNGDWMSHYAHIQHNSVLVRVGQQVRRGEMIARVGNSGMSHGPHLHFTVVDRNWISVRYEFAPVVTLKTSRWPAGLRTIFASGTLIETD